MYITSYTGDNSFWEKSHTGIPLVFHQSRPKAVSCVEQETERKIHIILRNQDKVLITCIGTGKQNIEFIKEGNIYRVAEIIMRKTVILRDKDGRVVYNRLSRVENFLPSWFYNT